MGSPEDLLSQRNKLQQQILDLETALGADSSIIDLLSSSSSSDEESDDSGHAGEEAVPKDLEAKRQKIQREIEALEQTLGADAALVAGLTDSEHGTGSHMDSSDENSDEDLELPQDVETCLQMNLVYQEVLKEKLADLERLLNENRQQQKEIESQLSGRVSASPGLPHTKLFLGTFMKPYFKDKLTGLGPPANEETKEKLSHGTRPCDEMKIRRWEGWQKTLLLNSVVSDTMRRMLQPKMSKLDYLTAKMSKAKDVQKEELEKQIALLEKDIEEISSLSEDQLYGNRHDDHDWDKIANTDFEGLREPDDLMRFWQNYLHPYINKSTWKEDEVEKLSAIVEQFKCSHWDQIAEALGTNRTAFMCFQTYQRYIAKSFRKREWTKEEDQILRDLVEKMRIGNFIPYVQLSYFMEGRDSAQIMYRWTSVLDPSIKKGPWSKEEDELLRKAVEKYGLKDWWKIRLEVPGRTDNACRDRYLDCLRDDVKRGTWSDEEVELLKKLVEKYGVGKWAKIASEIPNRIDSQCLNKWKWMTRCAAKQGGQKRQKRSTKPESESKSKRRKKKIKVEEDSEISEKDSTSEDEKIKVEYMDSDEEQKKVNIPCEKDTDFREEYIQPDIKEWIPVYWKANLHREGIVRTMLVRLPTEEDCDTESCYRLMRCTMLNCYGFPVKTYMIREPVALNKWDLCNEKAMILVRTNEVKNFLTWMKASAVKGIAKRISNRLSAKRQKCAKSDGQETSSGQTRSGQTIQCTQTTHTSKAISNSNLDYSLLMAVIPWIGNVLLPPLFCEKKVCEADAARRRAADVPLPKTAVFVLFLKVLHIDAEGCKKVIEAQKYEPRPQPVRLSSSVTVKTVAMLLAEKKEREARKLADPPPTNQTPSQPIPPGPQQTSPTSIAPQASVITQPKIQQGVLPSQPAEPGIVHLLQSSAQATSKTVQPVLQLVAPVEPGKSAQPATLPTTSVSSPSSTVPPTDNAHKARASTRNCKPTLKAQALKETKASKKHSAKNKPGSGGTRTVAVLPQTTAWIITSAGLMPVQLPPPGIVGNQKQVMPSSVPQVFLQPPAIVNQNGPAKGPSDTTEVTSSTAGTSLNQNLTSSAVSKSPNGSRFPAVINIPGVSSAATSTTSVSLVPSNTSNGPTAVTASALKGKTPERQCNQNQNLVNVVPQVPIQSPIILSQSASRVVLRNAVPSKIPSNSSPTAVANPAGPSQNSASSPAFAFISSPVVRMPSSAVLGNQKQRMSNSASRVVFPQPVIVNQNGSLTLVSAAGPHLPILTSPPTPMANISEVPSSPAASSAPSVSNGPAVHTVSPATVAGSDISTVPTSHAIPVKILPKNVVQQTSLQTNKQPLPTASSTSSPTSNPSPNPGFLSFDPNLMFLEHPDQVKNWITGNGGISLPQLHNKMPYLPPFVSSINTLVSLLKAKESFLRGAMQLLPDEERANSEEESKITAIRKLVSDRFKTNSAYSLLKARFLSCFTLPALLATIHPCKESRLPGSDKLDGDEDEDNKDEVEVMLGENEDQSAVHLLNTNTSEAAATQFSGMSPRKQCNSQNTA